MWVALLGAATVTQKTNLSVGEKGKKSKKKSKEQKGVWTKNVITLLVLGLLG